jgi:hypothetical protein
MGFGGSRDDNLSPSPAISAGRRVACPYLAGLCVAALGVCGGGWLVLTPFAFGYPGRGRAAVTALATGGGLVVVCLTALACWAALWRRKLRADGVLPTRVPGRSRRSARRQARAERLVRAARQRELVTTPDPAQVLTDLRELLTPLLTDGVELMRAASPEPAPPEPVQPESVEPESVEPESVEPESVRPEPVRPEPVRPEPGRPEPVRAAEEGCGGPLHGAKLLVVGAGEEEAW